ncbi:DUF4407 domain-containing protein [uncultured Thiohalocapsa sp.]|uniref:DUF4407 domain-containing protein n=1 Tax=uncultured Thiohalocapsa sp. TaxID=768990 RepID=UPI0025E5558A|nr:DUF4407 domain-containing protein [uncultured Thiohalocapsa sp.]
MDANAQGPRPLAALRNALARRGAERSAPRGTDTSVADDTGFARRPSHLDIFTLRPYGRSLLTPAARAWLGSAWVVILLMASIEGFVWGAVGASLVPSAAAWLRLPVAAFMFVLLFAIVWIVDASLIMSERPSFARRRRHTLDERGGVGPVARWYAGIAVRIAIVAISLYVTAPFIEKLIRADDIAAWHQARVERYYEARDATLREQVRARAEQRDEGLLGRVRTLEQDIARLEASLAAERERRERIEAEFAPQIEVLTRDLAAARERVGDEVLGRDGRPEGYGPEARKWDQRATLLEAQLAEIQARRDERLAGVLTTIAELEQRLGKRTDALQTVRREQAALVERISAEVASEQPPAMPPKLTFAARSKALADLKSSPAEAGVPHFESVEGFAQAALGILFFALLALKLFEPLAVHAYYNENVQLHYRKYLRGGLDHIPGFDDHDDPARRLSPMDFARLWERWARDPEGYTARFQSVHAAQARLKRLLADDHYESELLARRRDDIDARLHLERRRQEAELAAREQTLALEARETERRLCAETDVELEQLAHKRAEARKAHETALADMERRAETEHKRLDEELSHKRAAWAQERAAAEAALDLRRRECAREEQRTREQSRRKQMALDDRRRLKERELTMRGDMQRTEHETAAHESRVREARSLLDQEREAEARLRAGLADLRTRRSEHADRAAALNAELQQLGVREQALKVHDDALRMLVDTHGAPETAASLPFAGDAPARRRRRAIRERKRVGRALGRLQRRQRAACAERDGASAAAANLSAGIAAMEQELAGLGASVERYRGTLDQLLLARGA